MDNPYVSCPFDPVHRILRSRIQAHIIKCEKHHPGYETCPFNATHRLLPSVFKEHLKKCPSRELFFPEKLPPRVPPKIVACIAKPDTASVVSNASSIRSYRVYSSQEDDDDWDD